MTRILDAKGVELGVGSLVKRVLPDGSLGDMSGIVTWVSRRGVEVTFMPSSPRTFPVQRHGWFKRTYRCPDLERTKHAENRSPTSAAHERSKP